MKYVTRTGRAVGEGRVTRASKSIRKRPRGMRGGPLAFESACHPMRMSPTPVHPDCVTLTTQYGCASSLLSSLSRRGAMLGEGLDRAPGRYAIQCSINGVVGYTDDPVYGLAYTMAADALGLIYSLIDEVN